jgi:hypothetical protein
MNILNLTEFEYFFINSTPQFSIYSYEIRENFKLLNNLIITYDKELKSKLILSRKIDLIEFFTNTEKTLLYNIHVFKSIDNKNIKKTLINKSQNLRKKNIENIKKYL